MSDLSPSAAVKRKQILFGIGILAAIVALSTVGVFLTNEMAPPSGVTSKNDIKTKSYIAPGEKVNPADAWRGVADTRLNTMEAQLGTLATENRELKARLEKVTSDKRGPNTGLNAPDASKLSSPEKMSDDELDKRLKEYEKSVDNPKAYPAGTPTNPQPTQPTRAAQATQAGQAGQGTRNVQLNQAPAKSAKSNQADKAPHQHQLGNADASGQLSSGMLVVKLRDANPNASLGALRPAINALRGTSAAAVSPGAAAAPGASTDPQHVVKTTQNYLPSGMFGKAVVLSGLDAPTGGQAQSNPHPVLLQLRDLSVLPNRFRYDWKECIVSGAGYGDISSERAYIRTESLSCVSKDGKVLDVPIKGYIAGEDGKAGMRGRLVSKQGAALANSLLAGVVSGIGVGLTNSATTQSTSALGTISTIEPSKQFQAGIGTGVGRALDRLANYYVQLAEKMFPIIEVDAGRVVDVVLTKGVLVDVDIQTK